MSTDAGSILDAIDGALRDCTVSGDAMRWAPEGQREITPAVSLGPGWVDLRGASIVLDRPALPGHSAGTPFRSLAGVGGTFSGQFSPEAAGLLFPDAAAAEPAPWSLVDFGRALAEMFRPLVEWAAKMPHDFSLMFSPGTHRRCLRCHPERKPRPLAVDGHAYRRRQRARTRRRRR